MNSYKQKVRFEVMIGGGISEVYDYKGDLTFKQAVQAWVRGQKVRPTDCEIFLSGYDEAIPEDVSDEVFAQYQEAWEAGERDTIRNLVRAYRRWVEMELMKQNVYNLQILEYDNPFTRG